MARLFLFSKPGGCLKVFYGIDQEVGLGCPNKRDDVALVQFLLRAVLEDDKELEVPAGPPLAIDGVCGPRTIEYIKSFQSQQTAQAKAHGGRGLVEDGRVSPALQRDGFGSISRREYTIVALNVRYGFVESADKQANVALDPRCNVRLLPSVFWQ